MSARGDLTDVFLQRGHGPTSALVAAHDLLAGHRVEVLADLARLFDDRARALPDCGSMTAADVAALIRQHAAEQSGKASAAAPTATQPADFFQPDHTYQRGRWQFLCLAVAPAPWNGEVRAVGYLSRPSGGDGSVWHLNAEDWACGDWTEATGTEGGAPDA